MKIVKRKVNLKPFMDQNVLNFLEKENKWDLYEKNLLNFIEKYKNTEKLTMCFPFIIDSFTWAATPEGSNYWIDAHMKIDRKAGNIKRLFLKDIIKEIGYENS